MSSGRRGKLIVLSAILAASGLLSMSGCGASTQTTSHREAGNGSPRRHLAEEVREFAPAGVVITQVHCGAIAGGTASCPVRFRTAQGEGSAVFHLRLDPSTRRANFASIKFKHGSGRLVIPSGEPAVGGN